MSSIPEPERVASHASDSDTQIQEKQDTSVLRGWRLSCLIVGLYLGIFLATMEVSIAGTALVGITNDLGSYGDSTWIVNSYLLTYTGFLIIWAQFSHVLGRKTFTLAAFALFIAFSIGCATAQTATQLIVLRAFQGIGGAGMYNMAMTVIAEAIRPEDFPKYVSLVAAVTAVSFAIGPLIGGAIVDHASWRWVFWINVPIAAVAFVILCIAIPNFFPYHNRPQERNRISYASLRRLDIVGALLFLGVSVPLVTALEEGGIDYEWSSGLIIALLLVSGLCLLLFTAWETLGSQINSALVPVLSWEFVERRCIALFMVSFLVGAPFTSAVIQIPQRLQTIHSLSALASGIRLLAFIVMVPVGAVAGAATVEKLKIKPTFALLVGAAFQLAGAIGFALLPFSTEVQASQYGFQVLFGLGSGLSNAIATSCIPQIVERKNISSALGANTQFRYLGGAVGLGVITAVLNARLHPSLGHIVDAEEVGAILRSTEAVRTLSVSERDNVLHLFADGFALQWKVILAFISAQVPVAIMMW
ncbi:MFS multidrug transporter-like protein [Pseudovirgaria hyperparasitica]|uniref:MFS multidrug transporter-like protein n=1 Tax=Pseudovirgaria hyperparasitica TaxID=470096 RepID=A0A6A6W7F5_9PEZI|nr:MFS multidrug transporter-like protein [Pseudovirgaria hyperparasitica]KAF2758475.1 MFS multidrug transporter-like protein [Pseudovirgaria hyperparasitica]